MSKKNSVACRGNLCKITNILNKSLKNNFDKWLLFLIIFATVYNSFHVFILRPDYINHDEGNYLYCSWRVSEGEVPYKDFFDHHISGSFFLIGGFFNIFGASLFVARALMVMVSVITAIFVYLIAKKIINKYIAFSVIILLIFLQPVFKSPLFFLDSFVALFASASAFFLIIGINRQRVSNSLIFFVGFFASLAVIFKQNAGFFWIALLIFVIYYMKKEYKKNFLNYFKIYLTGLLLPLFIYFFYLLITDTVSLAFENLFLFNFKNVNSSIGREFPYGRDFQFAIVPCIIALIMSFFLYKKLDKKYKYILILLNLWMVSTALLLYPLFHPFHAYPALAPAFIIIGIFYKSLYKRQTSKNRNESIKSIEKKYAVIFTTIILILSPIMCIAYTNFFVTNKEIPGSSDVIKFINENTENDDKILVMSFDPQINFLTKRRAPGEYQYLHRCFHTKERENEIVDSCIKENVKYIIWGVGFWSLNYEIKELKIIEEFINENYHLTKTYGNFEIYALNSISTK